MSCPASSSNRPLPNPCIHLKIRIAPPLLDPPLDIPNYPLCQTRSTNPCQNPRRLPLNTNQPTSPNVLNQSVHPCQNPRRAPPRQTCSTNPCIRVKIRVVPPPNPNHLPLHYTTTQTRATPPYGRVLPQRTPARQRAHPKQTSSIKLSSAKGKADSILTTADLGWAGPPHTQSARRRHHRCQLPSSRA